MLLGPQRHAPISCELLRVGVLGSSGLETVLRLLVFVLLCLAVLRFLVNLRLVPSILLVTRVLVVRACRPFSIILTNEYLADSLLDLFPVFMLSISFRDLFAQHHRSLGHVAGQR